MKFLLIIVGMFTKIQQFQSVQSNSSKSYQEMLVILVEIVSLVNYSVELRRVLHCINKER